MRPRRRWLGLAAASVLAGALSGGVVGYASADQGTTVRVAAPGDPGNQVGPRTFDPRIDGPTSAPSGGSNSNGETFLYRRRASDGTELRVWRYIAADDAGLWPGVEPASCRSTLFLSVDASSNDSIAQRYLGFDDPHTRAPSFTTWGPEAKFAFLAVPAENGTRVTVTFPNGATDTAVARDDVAVLAIATPSTAANSVDGSLAKVQATTPDGQHLDLDAPTEATTPAPGFRCPAELPPPGQQPADPESDRGQITELTTRTLITGLDESALRSLVDDPAGLTAVTKIANPAGYDVTASVNRLVFTGPDRAVADVSRPLLDFVPTPFDRLLMEFRHIDGVWKISRRSLCAAVALRTNGCPNTTR